MTKLEDNIIAHAQSVMELALEKEEEARRLRLGYVEQLQQQTARAQAAVREEQSLRGQLQADFEYNLQLVEERDSELAKYETALAELRLAVHHLEAENSELKVSLAESECAVARQREQHRQTTASLQSEMEESRRSHWEKVEGERRKCEEVRRKLEQRLGEVEGEGERVRLEVTAHYEEDARKTHHQHRTQVEQLESAVLHSQSQSKAMARQLEEVKCHLLATQEEARGLKDRTVELERQMRAQEWAWQDRLVVTETELGTVRRELELSLSTVSSCQTHLQDKCAELDRQVREKAVCLQAAKEGWAEREVELECRMRELEEEGVRVEKERREEREGMAEQLRKNELLIERLQCELAEGVKREREKEREKTDTCSELAHERQVRDELQATLDRVTFDLHRVEGAERVRAERERALEREWGERVREAERRASTRMQAALRSLTQDKEKMASEVCALKQQLSRQQETLDTVAKERDIAIATLNKYNLYQNFINHLSEVKGHTTETLLSYDMLTQQNRQLKVVIASMRRELEQLSHPPGGQTRRDNQSANVSKDCNHGYISYLESELVRVNTENRRLRTEGKVGGAEGKPPHGSGRRHSSPPPRHLVALGEALAVLQKEKTAVEQRVVWLQHTLAAVQASLRERQEEVYQLKAVQVPPERCQEKLLHATRSILSLLRERDSLLASLEPKRGGEARQGGTGLISETLEEDKVADNPTSPTPPSTHSHPHTSTNTCPHSSTSTHPHSSTSTHPHSSTSTHPHISTSTHPHTITHTHTFTSTHPYTSTSTHSPQMPQLESETATWKPEPLHFSDSEVEGQKSLDKLLGMDDILSSSLEHQAHPHTPAHSPHHHPSQPPPDDHIPLSSHITSLEPPDGVVAMEMCGRSVVRHVKPLPRKPHPQKP